MANNPASLDPTDPFAYYGCHFDDPYWVVRTFQPYVSKLDLVLLNGREIVTMEKVTAAGLYEAKLTTEPGTYQFRLSDSEGYHRLIDDAYRIASPLGELDYFLMGQGNHLELHQKLGAHPVDVEGVHGVHFALWAPNAKRVSVVGSFNHWDARCHPMQLHSTVGVWDIVVPGCKHGDLYKFELVGYDGKLLPLKTDPYARRMEPPPGNASIVHQSHFHWSDEKWMATRTDNTALDKPVTIYEVHLGSWKRHVEESNRPLQYRELANELVSYVKKMEFTHIELMPVSEYPFDGSWGYQPIGLFAPTCRFGTPDDFKYFVNACHQADIGVIIDWVPAHFPKDEFGLAKFDGTCLYEHADPRQGQHQDWGTLIFNLGRKKVVNYLISNALFWIDEYHIDGLRVDAVASLLYLDYSREPGQWVANKYGGNENLEAVEFLKRMNQLVHTRGVVTMAEESTAWPLVSKPTYVGGLGFTYKWNMGWMHDTLEYIQQDPLSRKYNHDKLTFALTYAFSENFVLPLSHDEVVHGKRSILNRMPGDNTQKFANLRLYYTFMMCHPGKKLMFMGGEYGQLNEWNYDTSLDWHLLRLREHNGVQTLVRDLNALYTRTPALHEVDFDPQGFEWIDCHDRDRSIVAFLRRAKNTRDVVLIVCNFTPVVRENYRLGVPIAGTYNVLLNSNAKVYGGSDSGGVFEIDSDHQQCHHYAHSLELTLPSLGGVILQPAVQAGADTN